MMLEGNKFLFNVLTRLFMSRWKPAQVLLILNVRSIGMRINPDL